MSEPQDLEHNASAVSQQSFIDINVQPFFRTNSEILEYLPKQYQTRSIPDVEPIWYQAPGGDYVSAKSDTNTETHSSDTNSGGNPARDPELVTEFLFEQQNAELAILNPLSRGNNPDYRLNNAICSATNDWLTQRWLDEGNRHGRFRGTIRVNPEDPAHAVKEIERFSDHPQMVQVGIPLQSREPYGKPQFMPIWEAAATYSLPVAVRIAGGVGIDYPPTPAGHPRTYAQYVAFMPLNYFYHLSSLIAEGVFDRIPNLKFVFADGGIDILAPLSWRLDTIWYAARDMTPWLTQFPSQYLSKHVRFCFNRLDGPNDDTADDGVSNDPSIVDRWMRILDHDSLLMFGSSYPYWYYARPADLPMAISSDSRAKILRDNAVALYDLHRSTAQQTRSYPER